MKVKISPSLMCADMLHLGDQLEILRGKADYLHVDIIDWHYVRNMCISPAIMSQIRQACDIPMDAHLMVDNVDAELISLCLNSGAESVVVDPQVVKRAMFRLIDIVKGRQKKIGVYINPAETLDAIQPYIHLLDRITFMSVDPGFAGQRFVRESLEKVRQAAQLKREKGYSYEIEIDGSCNKRTYREIYEAGVEIFVVGSSGLFGLDKDLNKAWDQMTQDIAHTLGE